MIVKKLEAKDELTPSEEVNLQKLRTQFSKEGLTTHKERYRLSNRMLDSRIGWLESFLAEMETMTPENYKADSAHYDALINKLNTKLRPRKHYSYAKYRDAQGQWIEPHYKAYEASSFKFKWDAEKETTNMGIGTIVLNLRRT